jgi:peptide/nickel transport system substrate-binding protein
MLSVVTRKWQLRIATFACVVIAASVIAGCDGAAQTSSSASTSGGSSGGKPVLTIGLSYGPASLNPAKAGNGLPEVMFSLTNDALLHEGSGLNVGPGLATSWKFVGKGNTEFQFTLRSGAKFSDGNPLNAQAVKTWLEYFVKADGPFASAIPIKSIQTVGTDTVVLHLSSPDAILPLELSEYENAGFVSDVKNPAALSTGTDGVGPYVLDSAQSQIGSQYTLVPNKDYFDQSAIHFSKVIITIVSSTTSMLQALQAGQLDVANVDASVVQPLTSSGFTIDHVNGGVADVAILDWGGNLNKALGSVDVRQALNYAINRQVIAKALDPGDGKPTSQMETDYVDPALNDYYAYNPTKAKALLAAAGYPNGFTVNLLDAGSENGNEGDPVAQAVANYWAAIGVKTKITSAASNTQFVEQALSRAYSLGEYTPLLWPTAYTYSELLSPKGSLNPFHVDDPAIDKAFATAMVSQGSAQAAALRQVNDLMTEDAVSVPVFAFSDDWAVSKHVSGFDQSAIEPFASEWTWNG